MSGYKQITFDSVLLEEKLNVNCCYIYNRLWTSFSDCYTIKYKDEGKHSENKPRSLGVGRNTFLSSPHLCFITVFICDLFVSRDDPLMS